MGHAMRRSQGNDCAPRCIGTGHRRSRYCNRITYNRFVPPEDKRCCNVSVRDRIANDRVRDGDAGAAAVPSRRSAELAAGVLGIAREGKGRACRAI